MAPEQYTSFIRVVEHQAKPLRAVWSDGSFNTRYIALRFDHIIIGIETDGYAHS